jgi:hypothetical protein
MRLQQWFTGAFLLVVLSSGPAYGLQSPVAVAGSSPALGIFGRQKTINLSVRNDSKESVELRNGDHVMKLEPGTTVTMALPIGGRVVFEKATATHVQGDLLVAAASNLDDTTIVIH